MQTPPPRALGLHPSLRSGPSQGQQVQGRWETWVPWQLVQLRVMKVLPVVPCALFILLFSRRKRRGKSVSSEGDPKGVCVCVCVCVSVCLSVCLSVCACVH